MNREKLKAVVDVDDIEKAEITGFVQYSTTGDVIVPMDWVEKKWEEHGLPDEIRPSSVYPRAAYNRAIRRLLDDGWDSSSTWDDENGRERQIRYRLESGSDTIQHLYADVYYAEDEIGVEEGDWKPVSLGYFKYNPETERVDFREKIDENSVFFKKWESFVGRLQGLHIQMRTHYTGQNMRTVINPKLIRDHALSVPMRDGGAVYFFPAQYSAVLDSLENIWEEMNEFKEGSGRSEIARFPVINDEKFNDIIARRAQKEIDGQVGRIIDEYFELIEEGGDNFSLETAAEGIIEDLKNKKIIDIQQEYTALLETELSIRRHLQNQLSVIDGEKENLIKKVLASNEISKDE